MNVRSAGLCLVIGVALACAMQVHAAGRPQLEIDFSRPVWKELLTADWGRAEVTVDDGALKIAGRGSLVTQYFPCNENRKIKVSVRARCAGVEPFRDAWHVGRCVLVGYDILKKEVCHTDVMLIRGDAEWKSYSLTHTFPTGVTYHRIALMNQGKGGTVWFDDLELSVEEQGLEDLVGDPGFEGPLGVDHWYFRKTGTDWDDLDTWNAGSEIGHDTERQVLGKRCIKITGAATLVSKLFPYHGEQLYVGAWKKLLNVVRGTKRGWCRVGRRRWLPC